VKGYLKIDVLYSSMKIYSASFDAFNCIGQRLKVYFC